MFCQQNTNATPTCLGDDSVTYNNDFLYLNFEQDCSGSSTHKSMLIFRVNLDSANYNVNKIPEMAVYFGDRDGETNGQTIAVDEYGFIYVHGMSESKAFFATTS